MNQLRYCFNSRNAYEHKYIHYVNKYITFYPNILHTDAVFNTSTAHRCSHFLKQNIDNQRNNTKNSKIYILYSIYKHNDQHKSLTQQQLQYAILKDLIQQVLRLQIFLKVLFEQEFIQ